MSAVRSRWLASSLAILGLCLFVSPAFAQGQLWVVDQAGGGDFVNVQRAINAAADGDTILIRDVGWWPYGRAVIDGKALSLAGDTPPSVPPFGMPGVMLPKLIVRNLAADQVTTLEDLTVMDWIELENNAGAVWAEQVVASGWFFDEDATRTAIKITDCASVTLVRCRAWGPVNVDACGVESIRSELYTFKCTLRGRVSDWPDTGPVDGPAGVKVTGGQLFDSGSLFLGGAGETDYGGCGPVGDGGPGLLLGTDSPRVHLVDTDLQGGLGGYNQCGETGSDGPPSLVMSGTLTPFAGETSRLLSVRSPMRGRRQAVFHYDGEPGDIVFWATASGHHAKSLLHWRGVLLLDASLQFQVMGFVESQGKLDITMDTVAPAPGTSYSLFSQAAALDTAFHLRLTSGTVLTVLP
jgi:hypothetical protein